MRWRWSPLGINAKRGPCGPSRYREFLFGLDQVSDLLVETLKSHGEVLDNNDRVWIALDVQNAQVVLRIEIPKGLGGEHGSTDVDS